jgi:hypothetical protein
VAGAGDALAEVVDLPGDVVGFGEGVFADFDEHFDDVFESMLVVVPNDDVVVGFAFGRWGRPFGARIRMVGRGDGEQSLAGKFEGVHSRIPAHVSCQAVLRIQKNYTPRLGLVKKKLRNLRWRIGKTDVGGGQGVGRLRKLRRLGLMNFHRTMCLLISDGTDEKVRNWAK